MRTPARLFLTTLFLAASAFAASDATPAPALATSAASAPAAKPASTTTPASAPPATPAAKGDQPVPVTAPVDLFNGKDLTGWSYYARGQQADVNSVVQIKDGGVLAVSNTPNGYLVLDPVRANYDMHFEWRWTTDSPRPSTNSGVLLHISPGELQQGIWPVSFQFQLKVQRAGDIICMSTAACAEAAAGKTADRQKDASEKPAGEWNSADAIVRGDTIECIVNGVVQNKVTKCVPQSGKIGFQMEGYAYELRNLKLTPLEPEKPAPKP